MIVLQRMSLAVVGQVLEAIALLVAVTHFLFGPIERGPGLEAVAAHCVAASREAVTAASKGEGPPATLVQSTRRLGPDAWARCASVVAGGPAIIAGVIGFVIARTDVAVLQPSPSAASRSPST